jgi:hypothetical protein
MYTEYLLHTSGQRVLGGLVYLELRLIMGSQRISGPAPEVQIGEK